VGESRKLDMVPFADNTVTMIGELRRFDQPGVWVHPRIYRVHPSVQKAAEDWNRLALLLRGIEFYSAQMVSRGDAR
jgi:hypothetical protein